jgi:hypothetical protein
LATVCSSHNCRFCCGSAYYVKSFLLFEQYIKIERRLNLRIKVEDFLLVMSGIQEPVVLNIALGMRFPADEQRCNFPGRKLRLWLSSYDWLLRDTAFNRQRLYLRISSGDLQTDRGGYPTSQHYAACLVNIKISQLYSEL